MPSPERRLGGVGAESLGRRFRIVAPPPPCGIFVELLDFSVGCESWKKKHAIFISRKFFMIQNFF